LNAKALFLVTSSAHEKSVYFKEALEKVQDQQYEIAVLPWEPKPCLPFGTDSIETAYIALSAQSMDKGVRVVVLPVIPIGVNTGQRYLYDP
jgi:creatinine amidohydrolase